MPRGKTKNNIIHIPTGAALSRARFTKSPLTPCDATSFPCC